MTAPVDKLRAAAAKLRATPERPVDRPLAAWLEQSAEALDTEVTEVVPDCCGETHTDAGLLHLDGCGGWFTTYRDHGDTCRCWNNALAVARAITTEETAQ